MRIRPDPDFYLGADPDPAFYLGADTDPDPGSQTSADPYGSMEPNQCGCIRIRIRLADAYGSGSDFIFTKKVNFFMKNKLYKKHTCKGPKAFLEKLETRFLFL
jgi:hypothetical protein